MKKTQKRKRRVVQALAAALLAVLTAAAAWSPVLAVTKEEIDALKEEAGSLQTQKAALQEQLDALSGHLDRTLEQKALLDSEIALISDEIGNLDAQIRVYEERIAEKEAELADAQEREAEQTVRFRERVRSMEEQGRSGYLTVLFRADSLADLLSRLDFVSEVMDADQRVIDGLKALQEEITQTEAALQTEKASVETVRLERLVKQAELDRQRDAANALIRGLKASKAETEGDLDDLSAEEEAVQAEIQRLSRELAEEEAEAARQAMAAARDASWYGELTTPATLGGYAWPVNSRRINSTFGGRASPGGIGSTNHKGIDIGGVGYGTDVHASKAGKVIVSQYSSSYGNYVVLSHGSGNTTLYAHMSKRSVSVGQSVSQGDILGTTGSTGCSTGPHLHFEISENGVRVNPLKYLTDYHLAG